MADPDEWWMSLSHERRATIQGWLDPNARTHAETPGQQELFDPPPDQRRGRATRRRARRRKETKQ